MLKLMAFSVVHIKQLGFIDVHTPENGICSIGIDPQPYVPILRKKIVQPLIWRRCENSRDGFNGLA